MADYLDNKGTRGKERAHIQINTTTNIFNWKSALKEEVAAFIKQQKEDYKDEHLYNFVLWELFKEDFKGFTKKAFKKVGKSEVLGLYVLLKIYKV